MRIIEQIIAWIRRLLRRQGILSPPPLPDGGILLESIMPDETQLPPIDPDRSPRHIPDPEESEILPGAPVLGDGTTWIPSETPFPEVPGYNILRKIGGGGQAEVFEAVQESTGNHVALKVSRDPIDEFGEVAKRIRQEIEVLALIHHPNVVSIYGAGVTIDKRFFIAMEYIRGEDLASFVRNKKLPLARILNMFRTVCEAVDELHRRGIVHRDLKPRNILVDHAGRPKVLDMGLAIPLASTGALRDRANLGTLPYMCPEQTQGDMDAISIRSDVYALGVVLFELVTGQHPYPICGSARLDFETIRTRAPGDMRAAWRQAAKRMAGAPEQCPFGRELEAIITRALAKDPRGRFSSAGEFGRAIDEYQRGKPIHWWSERPWFPLYVTWTHWRRWVARHRVTAFALAVLLAWGITETAGVYAICHSSLRSAHLLVLGLLAEKPLEQVRVISDKSTDYMALAKGEIPGLSEEKKGFRRPVHGKLMKVLARSGCRAVVWDMGFETATEFDKAFLDGVRALKGAQPRIEVTVVVRDWWLNPPREPKLSETIAKEVRYGVPVLDVNAEEFRTWAVPLVVQRGVIAQPSVVFAALAAAHCPFGEPTYSLDGERRVAQIDFKETRCTEAPLGALGIHEFSFPLTDVVETTTEEIGASVGDDPIRYLEAGDLRGELWFLLPSQDLLNSATTSYEEVLEMSDEKLRGEFGGKVVLVGPLSDPTEISHYLDDRMVYRCYGHAVALDNLLRGEFLLKPSRFGEMSATFGAAAFGALAGAGWLLRRRWFVACMLTAGLGAISVAAYLQGRWLWDPLPAVIAVWTAAGLGAVVLHVWSDRRADISTNA